MPSADKSARGYALTLLSRKPLSCTELERTLHDEFSKAEVADAMALMREYGYLDDVELARQIADHAARQGKGIRWIEQVFERRGIRLQVELTSETLAASIARARTLLARRFGAGPRSPADKRRAYAFLARRGFLPETIRELVDVDVDVDS